MMVWQRSARSCCPATLRACPEAGCPAISKYDDKNVFLSMPYADWYRPYRAAVHDAVEIAGFRPVTADGTQNPVSLPENVCQAICTCGAAVVDVSGEAHGVLWELGLIRAQLPRILQVVNPARGQLSPVIASMNHEFYHEPPELAEHVGKFLAKPSVTDDAALKFRMLGLGNGLAAQVILHCVRHSEQGRPRQLKPITGGLSGASLLQSEIGYLYGGSVLVLATGSTFGDPPADIPAWVRGYATCANLYILDAPVGMGPDGKQEGRNWAGRHMLDTELAQTCRGLSASVSILDDEEAEQHPGEEVKITIGVGTTRTAYYADPAVDYALVVRAPNPFQPDAVVMMMAGIHAPATHAAALAVVTPTKIEELYRELKLPPRPESAPYFEAVLQCPRNYESIDARAVHWRLCRRLTPKSRARTRAQ